MRSNYNASTAWYKSHGELCDVCCLIVVLAHARFYCLPESHVFRAFISFLFTSLIPYHISFPSLLFTDGIILAHALVCIATSYGLDGQGIKSQWRRDSPHPSRPALGPTQHPIQRVRGLYAVKRPGRGVDHPPHLAPRLKEE